MSNRFQYASPGNGENAMRALRTFELNVRGCRQGRRARGGVTLLELLIVIALLLAMFAIVVPNLLGQMDERRFESTGDVLLQHLLLARAHAQATGDSVEVRYIPGDAPRIESQLVLQQPIERWPEPGSEGLAAEANDDVVLERPEFANRADNASVDSTRIYESWANQELPSGYRISDEPPVDANEPSDAMMGGERFELGGTELLSNGSAARDPIRLALFLPDGSAIAGDTRWLIDDENRSAKLTINPWTGLPAIEPVIATDESESAEVGEDERDDDVDERSRERSTTESTTRGEPGTSDGSERENGSPSSNEADDNEEDRARP